MKNTFVLQRVLFGAVASMVLAACGGGSGSGGGSTSTRAQFGRSLVPGPASFPSGGLFTFRCGVLCVRDFHVESATISDGAGHAAVEYFEVVESSRRTSADRERDPA